MQDMVAGCVQFAIKPGDIDKNMAKAERGLSELAERNCRIAVLPEMWSCAFPYSILPSMAERTPDILAKLQKIAQATGIVIAGSLPEADAGNIFNTSYLIDSNGEIVGSYRKVHLFSLYSEHKNFGKGESATVFPTSVGKIGLMICYDLRFPELSRKLALEGAELICVSSMWPLIRIEHWTVLLRARAIENQLFVVGCNGCGTEERIAWGGSSAIVSPWGSLLAEAGTEEQTLVGVLNSRDIDEFRKVIPCFEDRVPAAYHHAPSADSSEKS